MSYISSLRCRTLMTAIKLNDEYRYRTHIKLFVGTDEETFSELSDNLQPFVKREILMTVEDEKGELRDVYGKFIILSMGTKAVGSIKWDDEDKCLVHFTVNSTPAKARFDYGSIVRIYSPDVPMSDIGFGLIFPVKGDDEDKPKRPTLTVVK